MSPSPGGRDSGRVFRRILRAFAAGLVTAFLGAILDSARRPKRAPAGLPQDRIEEYRRDLHTYLWGYALALLLTLAAFALVYWSAMMPLALRIAIGIFAIVQAAIHFRCFLHIDPPRQNTDDLHLIVFSALLLFFMAGGTIWVLANLASRMH